MLVYAFDTGGTGAVGFVSILLTDPAGVLAPVAASLGDRFPARTRRATRLRLPRRSRPPRSGSRWRRTSRRASCTRSPRVVAHVLDEPARAPRAAAVAGAEPRGGGGGQLRLVAHRGPRGRGGRAPVGRGPRGRGAGGRVRRVGRDPAGRGPAHARGPPTGDRDRDAEGFRPWTLARDAVEGLVLLARSPGPRLLVLLAAVLALATGVVGVLTVPFAMTRSGSATPASGSSARPGAWGRSSARGPRSCS